jgi:hypothetical protein
MSISLPQGLSDSEHPTKQDDVVIFRQDQLIGLQYQSGERPLLLRSDGRVIMTGDRLGQIECPALGVCIAGHVVSSAFSSDLATLSVSSALAILSARNDLMTIRLPSHRR